MAIDDVTTTTEDGVPSIRLNISGRTVYAALKNLLVQHYGLTPESVLATITKAANVDSVVRTWLNGENVRNFVAKVAKEVVEKMAERIIRDEVRLLTNGRIKITVEPGT